MQPRDDVVQHAGAEPRGIEQLRVQNQERHEAADQTGIRPAAGDAAPQGAEHQRAGKRRHDAAGPDPDDEHDVGFDPRPGNRRADHQHEYGRHAADGQDLPVEPGAGRRVLQAGNDGPAVQVVGDDLGRRYDQAVRGGHDGRQHADADQRGQPRREQFDEQPRQGLIRVRVRLEQQAAEQGTGQQAGHGQHGQDDDEGDREREKPALLTTVPERPQLVAQMRQDPERHEGQDQRHDRPPGMVQRGFAVEDADQMRVLRGQIIDQPQQAASARGAGFYPEADQKQPHHHHGDDQHHARLHAVGDDVGVRAAQHDVHQQHAGRDAERPQRRESQQHLEHDEPGHELAGQIETQQQGKQRHEHPNALGLIPVAEIFGDGAVAEAVARRGDQAHGHEHSQTQPRRPQHDAPHRRQAPRVTQPRHSQKRRAADGRGRERQRQKQGAVRAARRGEVVGVRDAPLRQYADGQHPADIDDQKQPGPRDE